MKTIKIYLVISILIFFPITDSYAENHSEYISSQEITLKVNKIMEELEKGIFKNPNPQKIMTGGGWIIEDSKGNKYLRSDLYWQCTRIIPYGKKAVPVLLKWINHKEGYMRYICARSLKDITGKNPTFYYFGEPGKTFNGIDDWFENAIKTWQEWYDDHKNN